MYLKDALLLFFHYSGAIEDKCYCWTICWSNDLCCCCRCCWDRNLENRNENDENVTGQHCLMHLLQTVSSRLPFGKLSYCYKSVGLTSWDPNSILSIDGRRHCEENSSTPWLPMKSNYKNHNCTIKDKIK